MDHNIHLYQPVSFLSLFFFFLSLCSEHSLDDGGMPHTINPLAIPLLLAISSLIFRVINTYEEELLL